MAAKLNRNPDLVWRDEPERRDEIIEAMEEGLADADAGWVIVVDAGEIHQLNLIAGDIWMLCDGTRDEAAIAAQIAANYEADILEVSADVAEFVADCLGRGWLVEE